MDKIITQSEKETYNFAKKYALKLKGGEVIGLVGDLGAGKTVFAQGFAAGLGIKNTVNSPTFVLMKVYTIKNDKFPPKADQPLGEKIKNFVHIDAYRISNSQDIMAIGAEEYFGRSDTVTVIEWADKIKNILPKKLILFTIKIKNNRRLILNNIKGKYES